MTSDNYNTFLAMVLSFLVIVLWGFFFPPQNNLQQQNKNTVKIKEYKTLEESLSDSERVQIESPFLNGSIALRGLKFDDLLLSKYYTTQGKDEHVRIFKPSQTKDAYFAEIGWISKSSVLIPMSNTLWSADKNVLKENDSVVFTWNNQNGLQFIVKISLDDKYMFRIEQSVVNSSNEEVTISSYGKINRIYNDLSSNFILYEGPIGMFDKSLKEIGFKSLVKDDRKFSIENINSEKKKWFGISDKYWASIIILDNNLTGRAYFQHTKDKNDDNKFQVGYKDETFGLIAHDSSNEISYYMFVGPKELSLLDEYEAKYDALLFDRIIDFGNLYFITKPLLLTLKYLHSMLENFGFAIIALTVMIRLITLPLSIKSFISMMRMRLLQPKIQNMKEMYKNDKEKLSKETAALFKKHSIRPVSGCLPTILQIPIFFALYKVLLISIEMRHEKFIFWIKDLSMPDPINILNLFGLIKIDLPLSIGILPIILSLTMIIQQKISEYNFTDKSQANAMKFLPYILLFVFASFPSGLVLYWICGNLFAIIQQIFLKKYFRFEKNV